MQFKHQKCESMAEGLGTGQHKQRFQRRIISGKAGNPDIAISVVTLIEMAHGAARADTLQRKEKRQLPVHPVTVSLALRVGQIDGENQAEGIRLPRFDLLIGVTALEIGYSVVTGNLRHFQMIPGLSGGAVLVSEFCNQFAIT